MNPDEFLKDVLLPGLAWLEQTVGYVPPASREARLLLLAIAGQESDWTDRIQGGNGPAHSFWQMERGGGVTGVLHHPDSEDAALKICAAVGVDPIASNVWGLMATAAGDNLSVGFARLLLWTDPRPLPVYGDMMNSAIYYRRNWRPGKWDAARWQEKYPVALAADKALEGVTA